MSNSAVLCPDCSDVLGYRRRRTGTISVRATMLLEDGEIWLLCNRCGGRRQIKDMAPVLVPIV